MPYIENIMGAVRNLHDTTHNDFQMIEVPEKSLFPRPKAYPGQIESAEELLKHDEILLCSHTGSGKTAVFTYAAHLFGQATLIIEPLKALQIQVQRYYPDKDKYIFGRVEYKCPFSYTGHADQAACITRKEYYETKKRAKIKGFSYFKAGVRTQWEYPCKNCHYVNAIEEATRQMQEGKVLICNFGNYEQYFDRAKMIIIDEADAFFQAIIGGVECTFWHNVTLEPFAILAAEQHHLSNRYKELEGKEPRTWEEQQIQLHEMNKIEAKIRSIKFLLENVDLTFSYREPIRHKKNELTGDLEVTKIEIMPTKTKELKDRVFRRPSTKLIIVTATPAIFGADIKQVNYSIPQRVGIFYTPVGLMTKRNVKYFENYHLLHKSADFIKTMSAAMEKEYHDEYRNKIYRCIVHCGNLDDYARDLYTYLGGEKTCVMQERGTLATTIQTYKENEDARFLLVAGADFGIDIPDVVHQYVVKVPFASMGPRLEALKSQMPENEFADWYTMDALNRMVQQCGRVGRTANAFGCTFILDNKFGDLFFKYEDRLPDWFKSRYIREVF